MLLRCILLGLVLLCLRTEGAAVNETKIDKNETQVSKVEKTPDTESKFSRDNAAITPRNSGAAKSGIQLSPLEKEKRIADLSHDVASIIAEDILVASQALKEKGGQLSDKEAGEFFQVVAESTLFRIEESIKALSVLVEDQDKVAKQIAERIAKEAANKGFSKLNEQGNLDTKVIGGGVIGITKIAEEFIKMALQTE